MNIPTRVQFVRYYLMPSSSKNAGIAVTFGLWPERTLKHRGYTSERQIYRRVATEAEHEDIADSMRHEALYYRTLDSLPAGVERDLGYQIRD